VYLCRRAHLLAQPLAEDLPVAFLVSASTKLTCSGTVKVAICCRQNPRSASASLAQPSYKQY